MGSSSSASALGKPGYTYATVGSYLVKLYLLLRLTRSFSDETREQLHDNFEHEFDQRMIGSKDGIMRVPLDCLGPWHQLHWDGHEKLGSQALDMGGVGLPIYAGKDQYSAFVPIMWVIPNVRLGTNIGHLFLDMVEQFGCTFYF